MTYINTYTGKKFDLLDPQPEDICIEDIAHHLSLLCRYNGTCSHHYSVAQHCVLAKGLVPRHPAQALFHDAGEAYYGDFSSPLKFILKKIVGDGFQLILDRIDIAIFDRFGIPRPCVPEIKEADTQLFVDEWFNLMHGPAARTFNGGGLTTTKITPWPAVIAEQAFLTEAREIINA